MFDLAAMAAGGWLSGKLLTIVIKVIVAIVIFFIGQKVIKFVTKALRKSLEKTEVEKGAVQFFVSFLRIALYGLLIFFLLPYIGIEATSVLALVGSAGVAIGLAVQGSLSNMAGGVLILLLKPFRVGDFIIDNAGRTGTVSEIQVFYTKLITPDNHTIILPNGPLANNSVTNLTATPNRRLDIPVSVSYSADLKKVKEVLNEMLNNDEKILKDKEHCVLISKLADSGVDIIVRCWVDNSDYWDATWRITENSKAALDAAGIEIPFPQMDVHMR